MRNVLRRYSPHVGAVLVVVGLLLVSASPSSAQETTTTTEATTTTSSTTTTSAPIPVSEEIQGCWNAGVDGEEMPESDNVSCSVAWSSGRQTNSFATAEADRDSSVRKPIVWGIGLLILLVTARLVFGWGKKR